MPDDRSPAQAGPPPSPLRGFRLALPSMHESVATVHTVLAEVVAAGDREPLTRDRIALAVGEAFANAVEHGNRCDPRRRVTIAIDLDGDLLTVEVGDDGPGFDPASVPDPRSPERLLGRRGRGLLLMTSVTDEVTCTARLPSGSVVTLRTSHRPQASPIPSQKEKAAIATKTRTSGDVTIIDLSGKITVGDGDVELRDAVTGAMDSGASKLILNLESVTAIDSAGVGELVSSYTMATNRGVKLKLMCLPAKVRDILHITQLITIFEVYDTEAEAIDSFS